LAHIAQRAFGLGRWYRTYPPHFRHRPR